MWSMVSMWLTASALPDEDLYDGRLGEIGCAGLLFCTEAAIPSH